MKAVAITGEATEFLRLLDRGIDLTESDISVPVSLRMQISNLLRYPGQLFEIAQAEIRGDAILLTIAPSAELASVITELCRLRTAA